MRMPTEPVEPPMQVLDAGRYQLRPWVGADVPAFVAAVRESAACVGRWMSWAHEHYAAADAELWFAQCGQARAAGTGHEFGIFDAGTGDLVGGCGLNQFNRLNGFCNLGYWVRASRQRQGAARAAIQALARFGFATLELGRIEIVVAVGNAPSLAAAASAGALHEGLARHRLKLHGAFVDAHVFSLISIADDRTPLNRPGPT